MMEEFGALKNTLAEVELRYRADKPEMFEKLESYLARVRSTQVFESALKVGDILPAFILPNARGELVSSDRLLEQGPLVVSFFRGDWCPYCHATLAVLAEYDQAIRAAGAHLIAVTPELVSFNNDAVETLALPFEVLSDLDSAFGLQCGVIYRVPDDVIRICQLESLPERHGNEGFFLPIPAVFLVDQSGEILFAYADPVTSKRVEPALIVALLNDRKNARSA